MICSSPYFRKSSVDFFVSVSLKISERKGKERIPKGWMSAFVKRRGNRERERERERERDKRMKLVVRLTKRRLYEHKTE